MLWISDPNASPQDRSFSLANLWTRLFGLYGGANWVAAIAAAYGTKQRSVVITSGTLGTLTVVTDTEYFLTAASTATLPASPSAGQRLTFKAKTTATSTITANAGQTIGTTSSTAFILYAQEDYVTLEWDGVSIWYVVATNGPVLSSNQTATTTTVTTGAWTSIGNGLTLGTMPAGVYDFEIDLTMGMHAAAGATLSITIENGAGPISAIVLGYGLTVTVIYYPTHLSAKGIVLGGPSNIQGIYYSNDALNNIYYAANSVVGRIIARRIG